MTYVTAMTRPIHIATALGLCAALAACSAPTFKSDYSVSVTLTPAAIAALKAANEGVILEADYFGIPTEATREKANEAGQIELGLDLVPVDPATSSVSVAGKGLDRQHLTAVEGSKVSVSLRAYSGTDRADVVRCTSVTAGLTDVQAKPVTITCDAV
jgi:hypothetical protein